MNAATRLAGYGAGLAVLLTGSYVLGDVTDLGTAQASSGMPGSHMVDMNRCDRMSDASESPGGVEVARSGYTLDMHTTGYEPGRQLVSFRILGKDGRSITRYARSHDKDLHLIAVRRDFSGFQHLHPVLDPVTGTWSVRLDLAAGAWRLFADFVPAGGEPLTLGSDLLVSGDPGVQTLPSPVRTARVDGYDVTVAGDLVADAQSTLSFTISKDGRPVTELEPYLGAYGHLVALREGDLAYLHVHPVGAGPTVVFAAEVPSASRYHLFLDFKVAGAVHSAAFALDADRGHPRSTGAGSASHTCHD